MKEDWTAELEAMEARRPSAWARLVRPRVVVLPRSISGNRLGAWTLFHLIVVTEAQEACPPRVRSYVLGHEYGHIVLGHTALQWAWLLSGVLLLAGAHLPVAALLSLGLQLAVVFNLAHRQKATEREICADDAAADLCGVECALEGALWMTDATGGNSNPERAERIRHLKKRAHDQEDTAPA